MFALGKIKHLEKGKRHFASFSSKENFKKAQFIEHSLTDCTVYITNCTAYSPLLNEKLFF